MKKSNFKKTKLIYPILLVFLVVFWFVASVTTIHRISFSVVTVNTKNDIDNHTDIIEKNNSYKGKFKAFDNNLGIIYINLDPKNVKNEGQIVFSFKGEGKKDWEYQKNYDAGLFDSQSNFSFGVPKIGDSKSKWYEFEISSTLDKNNGLEVKGKSFMTGYQYSREEITSFSYKLLSFWFGKIYGSITDIEFLYKSTLYILPLAAFILLLPVFKIIFLKVRFLKILIILLLFLTIVFSNILPVDNLAIFSIFWISFVTIYKLKSKVTLLSALAVITVWIVVIPIGLPILQSRLNEWAYALLFIGCFQLLIEERKGL